MKKIVSKKNIYLLGILVIYLLGHVLSPTYAKFSSNYTTQNDMVGLSLNFDIKMDDIIEYEEICLEGITYEIFNVEITNSAENTAYYGIWYKMVEPKEKDDNIVIAKLEESDTATSGNIEAGSTKTITIIVKNKTENDIKINIGVATSDTNVNDIEYLEGKHLITDTSVEVDYIYDDETSQYTSTSDNGIQFTATPSNYSYTGDVQSSTINHDGVYLLEVWGAQGGTANSNRGGYGGYSRGNISLSLGTNLYIYIGGQGNSGTPNTARTGGYNGGGSVPVSSSTNRYVAGGGGASHIATTSGLLSTLSSNINSILIVAGGGGGGYEHTSSGYNGTGGDAGGYIGNNGKYGSSGGANYGTGGSQTAAGYAAGMTTTGVGGFGYGGDAGSGAHGSAGGGGFYGGGGSGGVSSQSNSSGGGGSGYIGNNALTNKAMYCYSCGTSTEIDTYTVSTTNVSSDATSNYSKQGNGYARITPIIPTISTSNLSINQGESLNMANITCNDNGAGCKIIKTTDTTTLSTGTHTIFIYVIDNFGYIYQYNRSLEVT